MLPPKSLILSFFIILVFRLTIWSDSRCDCFLRTYKPLREEGCCDTRDGDEQLGGSWRGQKGDRETIKSFTWRIQKRGEQIIIFSFLQLAFPFSNENNCSKKATSNVIWIICVLGSSIFWWSVSVNLNLLMQFGVSCFQLPAMLQM